MHSKVFSKSLETHNHVLFLRYFVLHKFICSDNCISKRAVSETAVDVGLNTSYVITDLEPYSMYEIVIRISNEKYSTDSVPVRKRTGPSGIYLDNVDC